ncbi:hypothetical protein, partial [Streptomyces sp. CB01881]|uniref:hypothetical protein n=1 Tax=Streptomyces sp. CB01881 TaxID=2078691 RepID=UPI001F11A703
ATARAAELRARIEELAADPTETEARLTDLATTRKIIAEVTPAGTESEPPETNTAYQAIVNAFNQHPRQAFRAREPHELLGMPTDEASHHPQPPRTPHSPRLPHPTRTRPLPETDLTSTQVSPAWLALLSLV